MRQRHFGRILGGRYNGTQWGKRRVVGYEIYRPIEQEYMVKDGGT